jgi:large repetitive protein
MWLLLLLGPVAFAVAGCSVGIGEGLPPTVVYATPADGSGNVPVTAAITAVFSTPMDSTTVTASTFIVSRNGLPLTGTVTCTGRTATFTPTNNLPGNSMFSATITTGAKDAAGNAVASNQAWTFMTIPVPTAGNVVLYYTYTMNGGTFTRSPTPVSLTNGANVLSQSANPDGSVTLSIQSMPAGYEDNGFYFYVGSLQYFNSLRVVSSGGSFTANLYLDVDNNGQFFSWNGSNVITGVAPDLYYTSGASPVAGVLTVDSTTSFSGHTIPQLRAGAVAGVSGSTRAAIWLGFSLGSGSQTATILSITQN